MTEPKRIQLSRAKGWRMPEGAMKVDRSTRYGNPWRIVAPGRDGWPMLWWVQGPRADVECSTEDEAIALSLRKFRYHAETHPQLAEELRGKDLACWCKLDAPCHADVLLELANKAPSNG